MEWTDYLREEEGMSPPVGMVTIPLCGECYPDVAHWKDTWRDESDSSSPFEVELPDDLTELLADLDTSAFEDDAF